MLPTEQRTPFNLQPSLRFAPSPVRMLQSPSRAAPMDVFTPAKRSEIMSRIRGKDTAPEIIVRRLIHARGLRFRIHAKLPGKPDIVLPKYKSVIFVHGCFWHGHRACRRASMPKTRKSFWEEKIAKNKARDMKVRRQLARLGYRSLTIWQCEIKDHHKLLRRVEKLVVGRGRN